MKKTHGADQKKQEIACLQIALDSRKNQKGESKRIFNLLAGEDVPRESDERPDFVRRTPPKSKNEKGVLLGIEHFRVDHLSLKKEDGRIASRGVCLANRQQAIYNKWHTRLNEEHKLPDDCFNPALDEVMKLVADKSTASSNTNYNALLASMNQALTRHIKSIDAYYKNLEDIALPNEKIELAFLIELHEEFHDYFVNDANKQVRQCGYAEAPLFADIIRMLQENIPVRKVQYVIICLGNTTFDSPVRTIALKTKDMERQLAKHHIPVYEYVSMDKRYKAFSGCPIQMNFEYTSNAEEKGKGSIETAFTAETRCSENDRFSELLLESAVEILKCIREHKRFITSVHEYVFAQALMPEIPGSFTILDNPLKAQESKCRVVQRMKVMCEQFKEYEDKFFKEHGIPPIVEIEPKEKDNETSI